VSPFVAADMRCSLKMVEAADAPSTTRVQKRLKRCGLETKASRMGIDVTLYQAGGEHKPIQPVQYAGGLPTICCMARRCIRCISYGEAVS
jgi:hypothetical protein